NIYKHYKNAPDDPNSLSGNNAWCIFEDSDKTLYIGTYWGGLNIYNREQDNFTRFTKDPSTEGNILGNDVNFIFEDSKKRIWVGIYNRGLYLFDTCKQKFTTYFAGLGENSMSCNIVNAIYVDSLGNFWIAPSLGLNYYDAIDKKLASF